MTTEADFLAAICAEPHDDTHRLVFADWLEEQNRGGLAAWIRHGVEYASLESVRDPEGHQRRHEESIGRQPGIGGQTAATWCDVCDREAHLNYLMRSLFNVGAHTALRFPREVALTWDSPSRFQPDAEVAFFRRGFVAEIHCPCAAWQQHGPDLVRRHPVEVVRLVDVQVHDLRPALCISGHPGTKKWPWMHTRFGGTDDGIAGFAADTPDEVHDAVGRAALAWAREEAKLPPLRTT
jgi:uncharacterized protein (TIGR02996 family)